MTQQQPPQQPAQNNQKQGQIVGYARVSTNIQDTQAQIEQLTEAGCVKIFRENVSARDTARPELQKLIEYVREGDVVLVTKIDRLCRNIKQFWPLVDQIERKGVKLKSLDGMLDTTSPAAVLMSTLGAAFAGFERELIKLRREEGISRAIAAGRRLGPKFKITDPVQVNEILQRYYVLGESQYSLAKFFRVSRSTITRVLDRFPPPPELNPRANNEPPQPNIADAPGADTHHYTPDPQPDLANTTTADIDPNCVSASSDPTPEVAVSRDRQPVPDIQLREDPAPTGNEALNTHTEALPLNPSESERRVVADQDPIILEIDRLLEGSGGVRS